LGLGGGARVGVVLRRGINARRWCSTATATEQVVS